MRKIPTRLRGTNFCTSSACFAPSFVRHTNGPECTQIVRNAPKLSLGSNGVDRVCSLQKISTQVVGTNFCTSSACFAPSFVRQPNGPECTQIVRNALKHQFRVQWGGSGAFVVKKLRRDLVARTFALVRLVLHLVFKATKRSRMHPNSTNTPERQFRVQ